MNETSQTRQITCGIQAWNKSEEKNNLHGMLTLIKGTVHYSEGALAPTGPILGLLLGILINTPSLAMAAPSYGDPWLWWNGTSPNSN